MGFIWLNLPFPKHLHSRLDSRCVLSSAPVGMPSDVTLTLTVYKYSIDLHSWSGMQKRKHILVKEVNRTGSGWMLAQENTDGKTKVTFAMGLAPQ